MEVTNYEGMRQFLSKPQNIRIFQENAIASIILFLVLIFIEPFGVDELDDTKYLYFGIIAIATFTIGCSVGFFVCYVLKMPLDPCLPLMKIHRNTSVFILVDLPISAAASTTIFGLLYCDHTSDMWWYNGRINYLPYLYFLYYTGSVGLLILSGSFVRNHNWHLRYQLKGTGIPQAQREQRQKSEEDDILHSTDTETSCLFKGGTTDSAWQVMPSQIIYVEAKANYVDICYLDNGKEEHKQLRITLKQMWELLGPISCFAFSHRSFIVNLQKAITLTGSNGHCRLQLAGTDLHVPVSRSCKSEIRDRMNGPFILSSH